MFARHKKIDIIFFEHNAPVLKLLKKRNNGCDFKSYSHEKLEKHVVTAAAIAAVLSCSEQLMNEGSRRNRLNH